LGLPRAAGIWTEICLSCRYVRSLNLYRRHLTASLKAMAAEKARAWYDAEAKERQKHKPTNSVQENFPEQNHAQSRDLAGKAIGVWGRMVDHARRCVATRKTLLQFCRKVFRGRKKKAGTVERYPACIERASLG
jgi:hypothetical protein